jgi:hypothetical protein
MMLSTRHDATLSLVAGSRSIGARLRDACDREVAVKVEGEVVGEVEEGWVHRCAEAAV